MRNALLVVLLACCTAHAGAADVPRAADLDRLPVWHQGRIKPFAVAADEIVQSITGKLPFGEVTMRDGTMALAAADRRPATALLLDWMAHPDRWRAQPMLYCPWQPLQRRLGLKGQWASLDEIDASPARSFITAARKTKAMADEKRLRIDLSADEDRAAELGARVEEARQALAGRAFALAPLAVDDAQRRVVLDQLGAALAAAAPAPDEPLWRTRVLVVLHERALLLAGASQPPPDAATAVAQPASSGDPGLVMLTKADIWLTAEDLALRPDPLLASWTGPGEVRGMAAAWGEAIGAGDSQSLAATTAGLHDALARHIAPVTNGYPSEGMIDLELTYRALRPLTWAWLAYLAGGIAAAIGVARSAHVAARRTDLWLGSGVALTAVGVVCNLAGLGMRLAITRLGAVTNLYETVIFVALLVAVLGLVFARMTRMAVFAVAGGVGAALCAMVGEALPPGLGRNISQLQPVLRSQFWLFVHVKTIVASYAAFLLAMVLGNIALARAACARRGVTAAESGAIYRALQVGIVLCAAGTLLGGMWADQAWGRFWGWDPKEVFALVILLTYLVPLHLRYVGAVGPIGVAAWSVYGFLSVVMSWYGVNFLLGAGKHAYAFGDGGQTQVLSVCALQLAVTTVELVLIKRRRIPRDARVAMP